MQTSIWPKTTVGTWDIFNTQLNWCNWIELQLLCLQLWTIICFTPECCFPSFLVLSPELWRWGSMEAHILGPLINRLFPHHVGVTVVVPSKLTLVSEILLWALAFRTELSLGLLVNGEAMQKRAWAQRESIQVSAEVIAALLGCSPILWILAIYIELLCVTVPEHAPESPRGTAGDPSEAEGLGLELKGFLDAALTMVTNFKSDGVRFWSFLFKHMVWLWDIDSRLPSSSALGRASLSGPAISLLFSFPLKLDKFASLWFQNSSLDPDSKKNVPHRLIALDCLESARTLKSHGPPRTLELECVLTGS